MIPNPRLSDRAKQDYELVVKAIDGRQDAYANLMSRYRGAIHQMMYKMVGNTEDANDLTQEAFTKAFNKLPSYEPRYAFSTWLFKIATNNCIDHIRKKRLVTLSIDETIKEDSDQQFSFNIKSSALDPEERMVKAQLMKRMRALIGQLSSKYRQMIEMRFFQELSYDEIASELNIPLGTVKAQLFRAKEMLHNELKSPAALSYLDYNMRVAKA
jgi:RNA polymerase sigma-70 factor (ECF subfamily)